MNLTLNKKKQPLQNHNKLISSIDSIKVEEF